jgi:hypothetical protein
MSWEPSIASSGWLNIRSTSVREGVRDPGIGFEDGLDSLSEVGFEAWGTIRDQEWGREGWWTKGR